MAERFFLDAPITGQLATLTGDEARHLIAVMRAKAGDEVIVFDGSGAEFTARIATIRKHDVELAIVERREISRELPFSLTLAVALPKGDRQKWLVEKATELGVAQIVPLITERGVAQPVPAVLHRLRRTVIEASKQCGRNRLMEICPATTADWLFHDTPTDATRLIADPRGQPIDSYMTQRNPSIYVAIGPEGGFAPQELAKANAAGWRCISLGNRVLRVETAAIALAACLTAGK